MVRVSSHLKRTNGKEMAIMRKNLTLAATVVVGILLCCGCASTPKRDLTKLQGTWVGEEIGGPKGECRMTVEGATLKFQGARAEEWYVATLTLNPKAQPKQALVRIGDVPPPNTSTRPPRRSTSWRARR